MRPARRVVDRLTARERGREVERNVGRQSTGVWERMKEKASKNIVWGNGRRIVRRRVTFVESLGEK